MYDAACLASRVSWPWPMDRRAVDTPHHTSLPAWGDDPASSHDGTKIRRCLKVKCVESLCVAQLPVRALLRATRCCCRATVAMGHVVNADVVVKAVMIGWRSPPVT